MDSNYLGWSSAMAPAIMGNADRPELGEELTDSFCRTDPEIAARFARVTFLSDNRADLPAVSVPTLVLQCCDDVIAPDAVGRVRARRRSPARRSCSSRRPGHCPNLSAPQRDHRRDPGLRLTRGRTGSEQSAEDLYEHAPCGYLSAAPGRDDRARQPDVPALDGLRARGARRRKRFQDLLTAGGRIYHETHYAPLLRMQGCVREIAVDIVARRRHAACPR